MEHTKGPWDYDIYDDHDALACNDGATDYTARIEWREGIPDQERLANLALISAAPDLLGKLEELVAVLAPYAKFVWLENPTEYGDILASIDNAKAAIAKAKFAFTE